jgi:hypothetical protein
MRSATVVIPAEELNPTQPGVPGPGGEQGVPGWPVSSPDEGITTPQPGGPTGITVEIPPIEIPPIEIPPVEVVIPPVEVAPVEIPPVETSTFEMAQNLDSLLQTLQEQVNLMKKNLAASVPSVNLEGLKGWLSVAPRAEVNSYVMDKVIWCPRRQAGSEYPEIRGEQYFPAEGYQYAFVGPVMISADFYSKDVRVYLCPDMNCEFTKGGLPLAQPKMVDIPPGAFWNKGTGFMVDVHNYSFDSDVNVTFFFPVIEVTEEFYKSRWEPLAGHVGKTPEITLPDLGVMPEFTEPELPEFPGLPE